MRKEPMKLKLSDLPYEVEKDVGHFTKGNPLFLGIMILGFIMIAVGLFNIAFGPDSLYIGASGPSFGEFLQLYSGPIASIGFLFAASPNVVLSFQQNKFVKEMNEAYVLDSEGLELPEEVGLAFNIIGDKKVLIGLNVIVEPNEQDVEKIGDTSTREKA